MSKVLHWLLRLPPSGLAKSVVSGFAHVVLLACALMLTVGNPASAQSPVTLSFSGTIQANQIDTLGFFGPAGGNLGGAAYAFSISYFSADFSLCYEATGHDVYCSQVVGSTTISLTINGKTQSITNCQSSVPPYTIGTATVNLEYLNGSTGGVNAYIDGLSVSNYESGYQLGCSSLGSILVGYVPQGTPHLKNPRLPEATANPANPYGTGFYLSGTFVIDGTLETEGESLRANYGPTGIIFNFQDVTDTTQAVVVGQQIQLTASPVGSGVVTPWRVRNDNGYPAEIIGGYTPTTASFDEGEITRANFDSPSAATFYFLVPGNYTVVYSYAMPDGQISEARAKFTVTGPTNPYIKTTFGTIQIITAYDEDVYSKPPYLACGNSLATPCITFTATASTPPNVPGTFQFVQTIRSDVIQLSGSPIVTCNHSAGLDTTYPYPFDDVDLIMASDSPDQTLNKRIFSEYTTTTRSFSARMYLMWNSGFLNAIFVPLAYVDWAWAALANQSDGVWTLGSSPNNIQANPSQATYDEFPAWRHIARIDRKTSPGCPYR